MRKRRLVLSIVTTGALVFGGGALAVADPDDPVTAGADRSTQVSDSVPAAPSPATHGVGIAEFAGEVRAKAQKVLGERFVEMWTTKAQDELVVGVTGLKSTEVEKLEQAISTDVRVSVEARNVSRKALDQAYDEVYDLIPKDTPMAISRLYERGTIQFSAKKDVADDVTQAIVNRTDLEVVTGAEADLLSTPFAKVALQDSPRVSVVSNGDVVPTSSDVGELPYSSGKRINTADGAMCTLAFTVNGAGGRYSLTAGHCGPDGEYWMLGDYNYYKSRIQNNTLWGTTSSTNSDAALIRAAGTSKPWVFTPNGYRDVVAQGNSTDGFNAVLYLWVCGSGASTTEDHGQERCGYISSINVTINLGGYRIVTDTFATTRTSGSHTRMGDSGSGVYGVNPDATAIALGILSGCDTAWESPDCDPNGLSYYTPVGIALGRTGTTLAATGRPPFGSYDWAAQSGAGSIYLAGWAIDPDLARNPVQIHAYVGGPAGSGAPGYQLTANQIRYDVGQAFPNTGDQHGFSGVVPSLPGQSIPVYVYAIDLGTVFSGNVSLGVRYVNVS